MNIVNLITNGTGVADGRPEQRSGSLWTYQATLKGTGAISATVEVKVSNDGQGWLLFGTMDLSGNDLATDSISGNATWAFHRADLTAISGTDARLNCTAAGV